MKRTKNKGRIAWTFFTLVFVFTSLSLNAQEKRDHDNFSSVSFNISGDLYISQGSDFSVTLKGSDKDLAKVITKVEDNQLIIKTKNNSRINDKVTVHVTMPNVNGIYVAGSGDVFVKEKLVADKLMLSVSGSGDMSFADLVADKVKLSIAGSGDISLSGKASEGLRISIAGSGDVAAENFEAKEVSVDISGSGSAKVFATEELDTNIVGSGSVRYKGNPLVNANSVGSGSTRAL